MRYTLSSGKEPLNFGLSRCNLTHKQIGQDDARLNARLILSGRTLMLSLQPVRYNDIASLRVFMVTLRKKLETAPDSPEFIQTHVGIGYRMLKVE